MGTGSQPPAPNQHIPSSQSSHSSQHGSSSGGNSRGEAGGLAPPPTGYIQQMSGPPSNAPDPLQSLKDVKVPGFSLPAVVTSHASGSASAANERPPSGMYYSTTSKNTFLYMSVGYTTSLVYR